MPGQLRKVAELGDYRLQARDGEIGRVGEIFFDDQDWAVRYLVVQTGRWLGRQVLILPSAVDGVDEEHRRLEVDLSRQQIEHAPDVKTSLPISRREEKLFYGYYGLDPYWMDDPLAGDRAEIRPAPAEIQPREPDQPHLRSSQAVTGYHIHADDGEIGHVEDLVVDDREWSVRYLEIDTRNWLPGKHVLLAPAWIRAFDWRDRQVMVNLPRGAIASAPAYESGQIIGKDYEVALYKHYGMSLDAQ